ncbi:MAG: glycosyltransferase family A protein [Gelidibacter sp.]
MQSKALKPLVLEILISTMYRKDFSFLEQMFPHEHYSTYNLLIINQTNAKDLLVSDIPNLKVINCFEFGVPKSRNLAIKNATGDLCLMADDDVVYERNMGQVIVEAYQKHPEAAMISFEAVNEHRESYAMYESVELHTKNSLRNIYTWVISFKRNIYLQHDIYYSPFFGFGSPFQGSEEYVFLRRAYDKGLSMFHCSKTIVMHLEESSGRHMGSDNIVFAKSAESYRFRGVLAYFWLVKYCLFIWRHDYIKTQEIGAKFKLGFRGIATYKALERSGEID